VFNGDWSASAGYEATRKILDLPEVPTAIFCQNDRMAIGCYEALKEAGYEIPRDMSVVGYDDEEIARHLHPQLTTSVLPHRAMGQWIAEQLADGEVDSRYPLTKLECPLVERASVDKPRG
jgi:LacI family transcriptional regulator